ncbi:MAG: cytochrome c [Acidimicrobiales bacterium]|jgi:cytochrome c553|nr:cytochrome c [Acidimicrobiales bacterium]HJM29226.1 cytochrome c [Acidimicrobiales bacterium]HJM96771.1 cytochrome c [Acidimicrobiales bacterium]
MTLYAASTQRTIGLVLAIVVAIGFAVYVLINIRAGRKEIGSEIELAPNRKRYFEDEILETRRLDIALTAGLAMLIIIALCLPLYWLGEPGRQDGFENLTGNQFASRGSEIYEEQCTRCHGAGGVGGEADYTILDDQGRYITAVNWTAPALNTILYRFSEEEVTHILNYGRPQSPMPAWGGPGGGPLTTQQLEYIVGYLIEIQLTPEQMASEVQEGLRESVLKEVRDVDPGATDSELVELYNTLFDGLGDAYLHDLEIKQNPEADVEEIEEAEEDLQHLLDDYLVDLAEKNAAKYGEYLFNNPAAAGSYACARCHTAGSSWNADDRLASNSDLVGLINPEIPGSGGFGPSLIGVISQFTLAQDQAEFISTGCEPNLQYGLNGVCEPSGQMPGFGVNATDLEGSVLTQDQISAIVEYERGL